MYKWLPIIFGCHCRPDRSFYWEGEQFPICARCTGELIGMLGAIFTYWFGHPSAMGYGLLLIPLIVDGVVQLCTVYESNNIRRLWTGLLFGYGLIGLIFMQAEWSYEIGHQIGLSLQ